MTGCFFLSLFEGVGGKKRSTLYEQSKVTYFVDAFGEKAVIEGT